MANNSGNFVLTKATTLGFFQFRRYESVKIFSHSDPASEMNKAVNVALHGRVAVKIKLWGSRAWTGRVDWIWIDFTPKSHTLSFMGICAFVASGLNFDVGRYLCKSPF